MEVLKKQLKIWIRKFLHRVFKLSVEHLDEDHKNGLSILTKQIFQHRILVVCTLLLGVLSAIFEGSSIAVIGVAGTIISGNGVLELPIEIGQVGRIINNWLVIQERPTVFLILIGVAMFIQLLRSALTFLSSRFSIQLDYIVKREIWEKATRHLMSFSLSQIQSQPAGYNATIVGVSANMTALIGWCSRFLLIIYFLLMYVVLLFISNSTLALLTMGITLAVMVGLSKVINQIRELTKRHVEATLDVGRITFEYLQTPKLIRIFNATEYAGSSINSARGEEQETEKRASLIKVAVKPAVEAVLMVGACVCLIGAHLVSGDDTEILIGSVAVFVLVLLRAVPRINELNNARMQFASLLPNLKIGGSFLRTDNKSFTRSGGQPFNGLSKEISFDELSFRYSGRDENVLEGISFKIVKGSKVAVVGPSGSGKSTLISLLLGLYSSTTGHIMIDGVPLENINREDWLQQIGYVDQEVFLFNASIGENIAFGNIETTTEDVVAAAKKAYADDFVKLLPQGYDTNVGDRGHRLSGGEKQRIGLARALVRKPNILLLDEATSALDTESESLIQRTISELRSTCTIIMIAHRLSTVKDADMVLVLDSGRVLEMGTVEQLMACDSYFLRVSRMQGEVGTNGVS